MRGSLQCSSSAVGSQACPWAPTSSPPLLSWAWEGQMAADGLDPDPPGNLSSNTAGPSAGGLAGSPACEGEARCPGTFQLVPGPGQLWGCYWSDLLWHRGRTATLFDVVCAPPLQHCLLDYLPVTAEGSPQS